MQGSKSASGAKDTAAREAALAKREQEVKRREAALASRGAAGIDPMLVKNFPSCCPMVHHDIVNDIPEYNKGIMRACAPFCHQQACLHHEYPCECAYHSFSLPAICLLSEFKSEFKIREVPAVGRGIDQVTPLSCH